MLSSIPKMKISRCEGIRDASALHSVIELTLSNCHKITDVSNLSTVPNLHIQCCTGITNWGSISNLNSHGHSRPAVTICNIFNSKFLFLRTTHHASVQIVKITF